MQGGGSFGRHLFFDAALEAAEISKKFGKPVKLMWHRTDDFRHGRTHPMATSRVRATYLGGNVLTYEQRHTSVSTDFTHGLGEIITASPRPAAARQLLGFAQTIFELTADVPYNFGVTDQLLNEVDRASTPAACATSTRPNVRVPPGAHRRPAGRRRWARTRTVPPQVPARTPGSRAVLDKAAQVGSWGRAMPAGTAQGIAFHAEYKGVGRRAWSRSTARRPR